MEPESLLRYCNYADTVLRGSCHSFYPDLFVVAVTTLALLLSVFAVLAILLPSSLGTKTDPSLAATTTKPV